MSDDAARTRAEDLVALVAHGSLLSTSDRQTFVDTLTQDLRAASLEETATEEQQPVNLGG